MKLLNISKIVRYFISFCYYISIYWIYKTRFKKFGNRSRLKGIPRLEFPENICIGDRVVVGKGSWLAATSFNESMPELVISDGCSIGSCNQIYSTNSIIIEEDVLTADRVFISDSIHDYLDIEKPILKQNVYSPRKVRIGSGTWIGINSVIICASVGKNCVIGANSVVTKDIPDYCVVAGIPAKILKRFNNDTGKWEKVST